MARSFLTSTNEKTIVNSLAPQFQGQDQECLIRLADATAKMAADAAEVQAGTVLTGSKTYDAASLAASATATTTVTVTGAALGDYAIPSLGVSAAGLVVSAYVSAADTVTVVLFNPTAGAVDLASTTLRVRVVKV
jgi:hypothetical protein